MRNILIAVLLLVPIFSSAEDAARRRAIETNLGTAVPIEGVHGKSLVERMKELGVPAVSYAVVEDGMIVLAAAYGQADVKSGRPATTSTLFQAASISKPVAAMGVMDLVERGKLSLDAPVNSILRSWKLPDNDLTAVTPVTLRMLLSHSGGTTVHGFPGYAIDDKLPTVAQVLDGKAPANTAPIVVDLAPNTKYVYSGGGIVIEQLAVVDRTGVAFPDFMRRTVLQPLGMTASTYEQPLHRARRAEAATAYRTGGRAVEGQWHVYPEMAPAGLWTTPGDLARVILEMQNALAGRRTKVLTIDAARHMLTPHMEVDRGAWIGLGFFIEQHGDSLYFAHGGANEGFRATFIASVDGSRGAVVMTNSDDGGRVANELVNSIAREYRWPGFAATPLQVTTLDHSEPFNRRYGIGPKQIVAIRRQADRMDVLDLITGWQRLYPLADGTFARADRDIRYTVAADEVTVISEASSKTPQRAVGHPLPADTPTTPTEWLATGDIDKAMAGYRAQFQADPKTLPEAALNDAGYTLLNAGRLPEAIAILQLNTELYPASANTYDSFGEVLAAAGQTGRAITACEELLRRVDAIRTPPPRARRHCATSPNGGCGSFASKAIRPGLEYSPDTALFLAMLPLPGSQPREDPIDELEAFWIRDRTDRRVFPLYS